MSERTLLDRWILSQTHSLVEHVREKMDGYDPTSAARAIEHFVVEEEEAAREPFVNVSPGDWDRNLAHDVTFGPPSANQFAEALDLRFDGGGGRRM